MAFEIAKAQSRARKTQHQIIQLNPHNPSAFGQMLRYLYEDRFPLLGPKNVAARSKELHELMMLAQHYELPGLQKQIVAVAQKGCLASKMTPKFFFAWAENMWYEQLDYGKGSFKDYFDRVAPELLHGAGQDIHYELAELMGFGGSFAKALFVASLEVRFFLLFDSGLKGQMQCFERKLITFLLGNQAQTGRRHHQARTRDRRRAVRWR